MVRSAHVDKNVTFPAGDLTLEGRVWLATGSRDVGVVLCHPHPLRGGNTYSNVVSAVAEALWQHDISTLRFNFRGTGAIRGSHGDGDTEGPDVACSSNGSVKLPAHGETDGGRVFIWCWSRTPGWRRRCACGSLGGDSTARCTS